MSRMTRSWQWLLVIVAALAVSPGCKAEPRDPSRDSPDKNKPAADGKKPSPNGKQEKSSPVTRVLFVGNSHVFTLNMPKIVEAMAAAHPEQPPLSCRMNAPGGWTLSQHAAAGPTLKELHAGQYDWVVLQEASGLAVGQPSRQEFLQAVQTLHAEIVKANPKAKTALYMVHARKMESGRFPAIREINEEAGKKIEATVIPVAAAWDKVRREHPGIELTMPDGNHFNDKGCYLTSCTIFSALTGQSCVGLPAKIGRLSIPDAEAASLQQAAWDAVVESKKTSDKKSNPVERSVGY